MSESLKDLAERTARETIDALNEKTAVYDVSQALGTAQALFDEAEHPRGPGGMFTSKNGKPVKIGDRVAIAHATMGFSSYLGHTGKVTHLLPDTEGGVVVNPDRANMHPLQTRASHVNHTKEKGYDFSHADLDAMTRELDRITTREQSYARNNPKYREHLKNRENALRAELHRRTQEPSADELYQTALAQTGDPARAAAMVSSYMRGSVDAATIRSR